MTQDREVIDGEREIYIYICRERERERYIDT